MNRWIQRPQREEAEHGESDHALSLRRVPPARVWGEALTVLEQVRPDARIINLETSVTLSEEALPERINYRMHPGNVPVVTAAGIDCGVLANDHVLDWGKGRVLVFSLGAPDSDIPRDRAADSGRPGIFLLDQRLQFSPTSHPNDVRHPPSFAMHIVRGGRRRTTGSRGARTSRGREEERERAPEDGPGRRLDHSF